LGDFVYSAMPDAGHGLSWDWQSNSDIVWADGVTQTASGMSSALDLLASMLWALNQQCWRKGKRIRLGGFPWNVNASQVRP
jgi:hypothetical protein